MTKLKSILAGLAALGALVAFAPSAAADSLEAGHARGMCLDLSSGRAVISRCTGSAGQDLRLPNRGADYIRIGRNCLAASRENAQLYLTNCGRQSDQYWTFSQNGTLVNGSGLCADVDSARKGEGSRVIGYRCTGKSNQRWSTWQGGYDPNPGRPGGGGYQVSVLLSPGNAPGMCMDRDKSSNQIILWGCHGKSNQVFTLSQTGRTEIRISNGCLAASPNNRGPVFAATCTGRRDQSWEVQRNGTIRNEASGMCLDVESGSNRQGTSIITFKCSGKANQRFNLYAR